MSLESTRSRRHVVEVVRDVVSAMRAAAAGRIQAAQRAMHAARAYREVVLRSLAALGPEALQQIPIAQPKCGLLVVITSEQPLCGSYNHTVIEEAVKQFHSEQLGTISQVLAVGNRGARVMAVRGLKPQLVEPGAISLPAVRDVVRRLSQFIDKEFSRGTIDGVEVVFARYQSVSEQVPTHRRLLPIDPTQIPKTSFLTEFLRYQELGPLVASLVSQFAAISLYQAAAEAYASEQASRLVAMDGATRNTQRLVEDLTIKERRERQLLITRQMLELAASHLSSDS